VAWYQALILGLQIAIEMGINDLDVYGDLQLVINQLLKEFRVKKDDLVPYQKHALPLLDRLETVKLEHVPRGANKIADALVSPAATLALGAKENIKGPVCRQWVVTPPADGGEEELKVVSACAVDKEDWRQPLIDYLKHGKLPSVVRHKTEIQRRASRFLYYKGTLYRCSFLNL